MCLEMDGKQTQKLFVDIQSNTRTPSQITGSKYSISLIAHCSQIRRRISINDNEFGISNRDSIDVRCRVLRSNPMENISKQQSISYRTMAMIYRCLS